MLSGLDLSSELEKAVRAYSDFLNKLLSIGTYFRGLTWDELRDSLAVVTLVSAKIWRMSNEYWYRILQRMFAADLDSALDSYLEYLSKLEDAADELANTPLYAAYINMANRLYMSYLTTLQNINNATLHALGLATRKDIVALGEAYVDLKGDLKRETKRIREEIAKLRSEMAALGGARQCSSSLQ